MNSIRIRPEASDDVAQAAGWYESQRLDLGAEFILEVDAAIDRAAEYPQHYAPLYHHVRRVLTRRFPYSVFFIWLDSQIDILAVLHQHRTAHAWRKRLE